MSAEVPRHPKKQKGGPLSERGHVLHSMLGNERYSEIESVSYVHGLSTAFQNEELRLTQEHVRYCRNSQALRQSRIFLESPSPVKTEKLFQLSRMIVAGGGLTYGREDEEHSQHLLGIGMHEGNFPGRTVCET